MATGPRRVGSDGIFDPGDRMNDRIFRRSRRSDGRRNGRHRCRSRRNVHPSVVLNDDR